MKVLHFLRGPRPGSLSLGDSISVADDLTDGVLHPDREVNQLLRTAHVGAPIRDLEAVRRGLAVLGSWDEVIIWHGTDQADQLMLPWLAPLLRDLEAPTTRLCLAMPLSQRGQAVSVQRADHGAFTRGYMGRRPLDSDREALLRRLWDALTDDAPDRLNLLQDAELASFPYWDRARDGVLARYPDATGLGFHDRVLLAHCDFRWRPASEVIDVMVEESEPVSPISRNTAWRRILRLAQGSGDPALLLRCSGSLNPHECDLSLTELGLEASEGSVDLLRHLPLCEWIGGTLITSPTRVWRWTENGLHRDADDPQPLRIPGHVPGPAREGLVARMRRYLHERAFRRSAPHGVAAPES